MYPNRYLLSCVLYLLIRLGRRMEYLVEWMPLGGIESGASVRDTEHVSLWADYRTRRNSLLPLQILKKLRLDASVCLNKQYYGLAACMQHLFCWVVNTAFASPLSLKQFAATFPNQSRNAILLFTILPSLINLCRIAISPIDRLTADFRSFNRKFAQEDLWPGVPKKVRISKTLWKTAAQTQAARTSLIWFQGGRIGVSWIDRSNLFQI